MLRHPSYKGLRDDKPPASRRARGRAPTATGATALRGRRRRRSRSRAAPNLDKVLYPQPGFTKRDDRLLRARSRRCCCRTSRPPADAQALPGRRRGQVLLREAAPSHRPDWVRDRAPSERAARRSTTRSSRTSPTLVWLANLADLELHTSLARAERPRAPDDARLRPRPRRRRRRSSSAAEVGLLLRGMFDELGLRSFAEDLGLEGPAGLRAAQRPRRHLRRRPSRSRKRGRRAARAASEPELVVSRHDQGAAPRQGADRLEPERRAQDDRVRLLAARARASDGLDAGDLGRGARRGRGRRPGRAGLHRREVLRASTSTATCSPTVLSLVQELPG